MNGVVTQKKRRVIVIVEHEGKLLVHKANNKWTFPDSQFDYPIDKPKIRPIHMAAWMILQLFNGLLDDYKTLKKKFLEAKKYISPSNYLIYHVQLNTTEALLYYNKQRKFFKKKIQKLEMHNIQELKNFEPGKYLGSTIESYGCVIHI